MKYGIIADIHGNLSALEVALAGIRKQGCDQIACLGDIVGYGPNPKECVALVRSTGMVCVRGNFDDYCSSDSSLANFNPAAAEHIALIRSLLSEQDREWLLALPYVREISGFTIVHATLSEPGRWQYVFDQLAAAASFELQRSRVCFFGHTHVPVAFTKEQQSVRGGTYSKLPIDAGPQYFINVGSVGQPRDGTKQGAYACYDLETQMVELRRFDLPGGGTDAALPVPHPIGH